MDCFTKLWTIKMSDWQRGLVVAVLTAPLTVIYESVSAGSLAINWKSVLSVALTAGIAYIMKNLATGQGGKLFSNKEPDTKVN